MRTDRSPANEYSGAQWRGGSRVVTDGKRIAMHEVSVCEHLLAILDHEARRHGVQRIVRLRVEIGRFSCLDPEALRFAFDALALGTVAEAAELQIDQPPVRATCKDCGAGVALLARLDSCTSCGGTRLEIQSGDEMRLLEMEAP